MIKTSTWAVSLNMGFVVLIYRTIMSVPKQSDAVVILEVFNSDVVVKVVDKIVVVILELTGEVLVIYVDDGTVRTTLSLYNVKITFFFYLDIIHVVIFSYHVFY